jgi:hypothetical protein
MVSSFLLSTLLALTWYRCNIAGNLIVSAYSSLTGQLAAGFSEQRPHGLTLVLSDGDELATFADALCNCKTSRAKAADLADFPEPPVVLTA